MAGCHEEVSVKICLACLRVEYRLAPRMPGRRELNARRPWAVGTRRIEVGVLGVES